MTNQPAPRPHAYQVLTPRDFHERARAMHEREIDLNGCALIDHRWPDCPALALARIRGCGHTVYVLLDLGDDHASDAYRVADVITDGPVSGLHARLYTPAKSWGDALCHALTLVALEDGECWETLGSAEAQAVRILARLAGS